MKCVGDEIAYMPVCPECGQENSRPNHKQIDPDDKAHIDTIEPDSGHSTVGPEENSHIGISAPPIICSNCGETYYRYIL